MTTKTDDIKLPEPAFTLRWHGEDARYTASSPNIETTDCYTADQVRAVVEANQQSRMPSDEKLPNLFREALSWGRTYGRTVSAQQWDELRDDQVTQLLSRYGSSQPTIPASAAQAQHCPTDVCEAAKDDGVLCADDECDRENGVRPAAAQAQPQCQTCGGTGVIGGPSYSDPGEGGERCQDCQDHKDAQRWRAYRAEWFSIATLRSDDPVRCALRAMLFANDLQTLDDAADQLVAARAAME